jgi:hypothetical protein
MRRAAISVAVAFTVVANLLAFIPIRSAAQTGTPAAATPTSFVDPPPEICTPTEFAGFETVSEKPPGKEEWMVRPLDPSPDAPTRLLYLVVITLEPGKCIPYASLANQKDGAIVLIVHEGEIEFTAQLNANVPAAQVYFGNLGGPGEDPGTPVAFGTTVTVVPDEWVSQDDQVWFTYKNPSATEDAVIWKVVWADPVPLQGCGGDCK